MCCKYFTTFAQIKTRCTHKVLNKNKIHTYKILKKRLKPFLFTVFACKQNLQHMLAKKKKRENIACAQRNVETIFKYYCYRHFNNKIRKHISN